MEKQYIPEIKGFDCVDHDPIEEWVPEDPSRVVCTVVFSIGMRGKEGADLFYVHAMTRKMLREDAPEPKRTIILDEYSWNALLQEVESVLDSCAGENWESISAQLSKRFDWEFENYQPYRGE